jgi:hypothetical protein
LNASFSIPDQSAASWLKKNNLAFEGFGRLMAIPLIVCMQMAASEAWAQPSLVRSDTQEFLEGKKIDHIMIWHMPRDFETAVRVTDEMFRRMAFERCEVKRSSPKFYGLEKATRDTRILGEGNGPDIRWELEIYDRRDRMLSHLYLSRNLTAEMDVAAQVDGSMVMLNKPLIAWLDDHLPDGKCVGLHPLP